MILKRNNKKFTKKLLTTSESSYYSGFECGNEYINEYVRHKAAEDVDSTSFIYVDNELGKAVYVYSLSCSGIVAEPDGKVHLYTAVEIRNFALSNVRFQAYFDSKYNRI